MADAVAAVVVLYHPDSATVDRLSETTRDADHTVVVVNAASPDMKARLSGLSNTTVIDNEANFGLARALNQGLEAAFSHASIGYTLLLDQDSAPPPGFCHALRDAFIAAVGNGMRPACIGPKLVDVKSAKGSPKRGRPDDFLRVQTLATSGTLLSREAYFEVGGMRDDLFIDCIDHEWCFRAQSKGFDVVLAQSLAMPHDMGELGVNIFGLYKPLYRSPTRHYYITRNTLRLMTLRYVPLRWKLREGMKMLYRAPSYVSVSSDRWSSVSNILRGVMDAVKQ